jgi:YHS domain-containing protein
MPEKNAAFVKSLTLLERKHADIEKKYASTPGAMKRILPTVIAVLISFMSTAQDEGKRKAHFNTRKNVALEGYDPVSYFDGKPLEGRDELTALYKGIVYQFANQSNLAKFKAAPTKFEPAYGGWCAYAMGEGGDKVKIDPETYTILNGRLYLFYNFWGNNTLKSWKEDEGALKTRGDMNWQKIVQ